MNMKTGVASTFLALLLTLLLTNEAPTADDPATPVRRKGGPKAQPPAAAAQPAESAPVPGPGYKLAWADEFDGDALDTAKWDYHNLGPKNDGVIVRTKDAVTVADGCLTLTTYTADGKHFMAMISTRGKFERNSGYYESRIKFQDSPGKVSAFWLTPVGVKGNPKENPAAGMEVGISHRASDKSGKNVANKASQWVYWGGKPEDNKSAMHETNDLSLANGFHVYGIEWTDKGYRFFVDGALVWAPATPVSPMPDCIMLSSDIVGLDGRAGGIPAGGYGSREASTTKMVVDYVRFYERVDAGGK